MGDAVDTATKENSRINYLSGRAGEKIVSGKLKQLPKDRYRVLNDLTIPTPKGSSQIDHVVVSIYGIFVIETKNFNGQIYGTEYSEYWTQNIYSHKHQFYNPILQNAGHILALQRVLKDYESLPIRSIVAFSSEADLKVKVQDACVIDWRTIVKVINQFEEPCLSWQQVESICVDIRAAQIVPGERTDKQHLQDIRTAKKQKHDAISSGRCPRCGGSLVLHEGKYGSFYGCSNYPRCRYTQQHKPDSKTRI